jgi:crotonobetainyl-CoA:carnitine CoA-transferase CaiB-like acyl-CoA transferase
VTTALEGLRVLQIGAGEATAIAGMVLAENGAEVVIVEPPEGSSDRNRPGHVVWNRGKKSVVIDLETAAGRGQLASLAKAVDGAIVALRPGRAEHLGADEKTLRAANPALVYVEIGGFGEHGPLAPLAGYQGVVAAASGRFESTNGYRSGPIFAPVPIEGYGAAMLSVQGLLAALYARRRTGRGQHIYTSLLHTLSTYDMTSGYGNRSAATTNDGYVFGVMRVPFMTAPTKDDRFIQMCARQKRHFRNWLQAMGLESLLTEPDLPYIPDLFPSEERLEEVVTMVREKMRERTRDEWMDIFSRDDIGGDPFLSAPEYLEHPQNLENDRSKIVIDPVVGHTRQIGPLVLLSDTPAVIGAPAPALGADTADVLAYAPRVEPAVADAPPRRPLEGVTVLECGYFYATPFSSTLLSEAGARVYKVEPNEGDPGRRNWTTAYVKAMVGKESIVLDLKSDEGLRLMYELVDRADVFIHNFRPGTPARLGIDYDTLIARNPRLVYVYGSCFGSNGPWARKAGFHSSPNAISGAGIIEAGEDNNPINRTYADPASALATAAAVMIGLEARERTGRGQYVETVMLTSMAYAVSEWGVSWDGKRDRTIDRGMHGFHALHRLYPTADGWLYLECHREDELRTLATAVGQPWIVDDPRYRALLAPYVVLDESSRTASAELADALGKVFATRSADDWQRELVPAGVPAVRADATSHHDFMLLSEQTRANDISVETTQPGLPMFWRAGPAIRFGEHATPIEPSDALGEHTAAILHELGLSDAEIAALDEQGVTRAKGNDLPD